MAQCIMQWFYGNVQQFCRTYLKKRSLNSCIPVKNDKKITKYVSIHNIIYISLSSSGMQHFLNICKEYAFTHKLIYNGSKSFALSFRKKHTSSQFFITLSRSDENSNCSPM